MSNIEKGRQGEELVHQYLIEKGYMILDRNFRYQHREIDIIALKNDILVFVEVKVRNSDEYGQGLESITARKKRNIVSVARYYVERKGLQDHNVRFDVASVDGSNLDYVESAFQI